MESVIGASGDAEVLPKRTAEPTIVPIQSSRGRKLLRAQGAQPARGVGFGALAVSLTG